LPVSGVDQAGRKDNLKWIDTPQDGDSPWILHVNEIFERFEPYDGRAYTEFAGNGGGGWDSVWLYPPVLQIFAKYAAENEGYRRLLNLEGAGQEMFHCFTKDTEGKTCRKLAICLWDGGQRGDDGVITGVATTHVRSGREWIGGADPGTDGTDPIDIMWRFFSVVRR